MIDSKSLADIRGNIRIYDNRVAERDVSRLLDEIARLQSERDSLKSNLAKTTRELGFANVRGDLALAELDPPVCRLQFPDGTVPANAREAAEGWKRWADEFQRRAELWERLHDERTWTLRNVQKKLHNVLDELAGARSHADLAASGGIVDAP